MNINNNRALFLILFLAVGIGYFMLTNTGNIEMMDDDHHSDEVVENHEIYPSDVAQKIENKEDILLLDIRTIKEYEEMHLENALLLPMEELSGKSLSSIGLGENVIDKEIIIYGRSGTRSKTAYDIMKSLGYTNIKSVSGGMIHWQEDENPFTESGPYTGPIETEKNTVNTPIDGPRIVITNTTYDFGVITQFGGIVEKDFPIKNKGTKTLVIGDITTSCSCTSAVITNKEIEPGENAVLTVIFDPDFHAEPLDVFKRTVFIPTNDPTQKEAEVSITVDIIEGK